MKAVGITFSIACLGLVIASPLERRYAIKETHAVPSTFIQASAPPGDHVLRMQLGMKQSRFDELERHIYETSDPDNKRYGQHLSAAEIDDLVRPSEDALQAVQDWLHQRISPDAIQYTTAKDFLSFSLSVSEVEKLLDTKYSVFRHTDGDTLVRTSEWSLPLHLHDHITTIQPTTSFLRTLPQIKTWMRPRPVWKPSPPEPYPQPQNASIAQVCNTSTVTPLCLRTLYGTVNYKAQAAGKNQVALCDYYGEINNRSDAEIYLQMYRPEAAAAAYQFQQVSVDGGTLQQTQLNASEFAAGIGFEGNLDIQTILGIAWPTPVTAYSTGGEDPPFIPDALGPTEENEPYLTWLNYILQQDFLPQVVSNSYADDEQTVPQSYADAVCSKFAQLTARGVSIFTGSGDGGVSGVLPESPCLSNKNNQTEFIPLFPASCPYVTTIGATVNFTPEVVAFDPSNNFSSGGGFSNYFSRPSYQDAAVDSYLSRIGNSYAGYYNSSSRAYPDLAAYGVNFPIIYNGSLTLLDGTSASTPTAASVFALVNDALIAAGRPPLGFLNPWLYKYGYQAFTDVTEGYSQGYDTCGIDGFRATPGWDAASGFGTPNFYKILEVLGLGQGQGQGWKSGGQG